MLRFRRQVNGAGALLPNTKEVRYPKPWIINFTY